MPRSGWSERVTQVLVGLFVLYVAATAWQARRALATRSPADRLREATRLLVVVSLGVPLAIALIFAT